MKQDKGRTPADAELRKGAEKRVVKDASKPYTVGSPEENIRLLHELRVHQIELEMQNEELREARLTMEAALEKYADLYDFAPTGYFTLDDKGVVLEANYTGKALLGTTHSQTVGHRFGVFLAEQSRTGFSAFLTELFGGAQKAVFEAALRGEPEALWVRIHGSAVEVRENEPRQCRIAVTDITAFKDAEREQAVLRVQMQQTQRLESLGVLAGGIAHDFNNLLMIITGNAGLMLEVVPENSPARPMANEIITVAGRAAELCAQMLAYAGKGQFRMVPLNLSKMAAEMSQMLSVAISRKALISCCLSDSLPLVQADAVQMRQVLMNRIINASEAVGENGGSISIRTGIREFGREPLGRVRAATPLKEGAYVFLEVADNGCGMAQETVEKMFDPFFSTKFLGRGLGLSAVTGIIDAHAGGICVESEPGRGTTITLLFPPVQAAETAEPKPPAMLADWRATGTVLLVEDEEAVRLVCQRMLEFLGLEVLVARDGREAVKMFRRHQDKIRCVLLDFAMPHLGGEQTFYELRRIDSEARVILSSGYLQEDVMARFEGQGLTGFLHKPYLLDQLVEVLKKVFAE